MDRPYMRPILHSPAAQYIGDGVYADVDPRGLVLTTEDGMGVTNEIVLDDPTMLRSLIRYCRGLLPAGE